jgi:Na+-driven multidrug efflux pump
VSIPALILGFMAGLFAFCDQLMMVKLIPNFLQTNQVFSNYEGYHSIYTSPNLPEDVKKIMMDANGAIPSIIRTAVAYSAPITVFINAAALLLGNGTAINYSKYNGAKNLLMAEKTWTQGFYANLLLSIVVTALCCGICSALISLEQGAGLNDQLNTLAKTNYFIDHPDQFKTVATFYHEYYDEVRRFASQYIYIMGAGCIFALYSQFISLLVIAEGKQVIVVAASIICNGINILLD